MNIRKIPPMNLNVAIGFAIGSLSSFIFLLLTWLAFNFLTWYRSLVIVAATVPLWFWLSKSRHFRLAKGLISQRHRAGTIIEIATAMTAPATASTFAINDTNKSASLTYSRGGKDYLVNLPYRTVSVSKVLRHEVILLRTFMRMGRGETVTTEVDITHQPGIPYMVSAKQLGGYKIIVRERTTKKIIDEFQDHQIPNLDSI